MKKIFSILAITTLSVLSYNVNAQNSVIYMQEKLGGKNINQHMKKIVNDNVIKNESSVEILAKEKMSQKKEITTIVEDWMEVKEALIDSCKKSGYEVKTIIDRQNKLICAKKTKVSGRDLELNIRFEGKKVMRGFHIDTEQWYEGESKDGSPKVYTINQEINQPNIDEIWNKMPVKIK